MRGFIDDLEDRWTSVAKPERLNPRSCAASSMTRARGGSGPRRPSGLNPRSCAASSMTFEFTSFTIPFGMSQSAFMRGFIDDCSTFFRNVCVSSSLNPRSCAASSMTERQLEF